MAYLKRGVVGTVSLWIVFGSLGLVWAQSDRGTITGTVTDPSGALIAGATVTATNTATTISTQAVTSSAGDYTIPLLRVGTYQITVEQTGMKKFVQTGVALQVGQTIRVDAHMQIGQTTQTVQVTAPVPLLQKDTSDRGTVVSSRDVEELPIVAQQEQRNPGFYMTLAPGVTGRGTANPTPSGSGRQLNTTVNGSPSGSTEFHLDGAVIGQGYMMAGDFRQLPFPPDAVGEFNVMTLNPPAQYGQTGLGITSFSLKSGTNLLHGTAYEYLRNNALDTRGFFAPTTPVLKQNEFGVTVGGPVIIPKIYNGKDKTFFFGWYDGFRLVQQATNSLDTVPTEAMRGGDFSNVLGAQVGSDALGRPVYSSEIYDPATQRTVGAGAVDPVTGLINKSGSSAIIRDAFGFNTITGLPTGAANIIPSARIDPLAAKIFTYFPNAPACSTCAFGYKLNWLSSYTNRATINQWGSKVDHAVSDRQHLFGEFIWSKNYAPSGSKWPGAISEGANTTIQQDIVRFGQDYTLRPDLINHWVFGFNRNRNDSFPQAGLGWPGMLGYSGVPQSGPGSTFIEMDIGGLGNTYGRGGQGYGAANNFTFNDDVSWIKGRHSIEGGFSYIKLQNNNFSSTYQSSYLTFNAGTTSMPGAWYNDGCTPGGTCAGMGAAGFLLGQVSHGLAGITASEVADRMGRYAGYVQDNFKASPKLTLNLGLRYDLILPNVSAHNQFSWMDPTIVNPAIGIKGALAFATPYRRSPVMTDTKAFGPRIGLAYALNDKTVLRGGYGILYTAGGGERSIGNSFEQQGYSVSNAVNEDASIPGATGLLPGTVPGNPGYHMILNNGWPASLLPVPPFISPSTDIGEGPPAFGSFPGDGNLPYIQTWDVDIQRDLPGQILFDVAYVGTRGTHLPSRLMNTNATYTSALQYGQTLFTGIADPSVQALSVVQKMPVDPATGMHSPFPGFQALWGGSATLGQALRPYPQYTTDTVEGLSQLRDFGENVGSSSYNALQLQARKHFSQGLSFLVSYTWSKTLTNAGNLFNEFSGFTQDFYNVKSERALSLNDYPSNLVISYEYQLPFGPGKKWGNVGGVAGRVIGGWSVAGVQQYQAGAPQMIVTGGNALNPYMGPNSFLMRPNVVPGVVKKSVAIRNGTWDPNGGVLHNDGSPCTTASPCTAANAYDKGAVLNVSAWCDPQQAPTSAVGCAGGPFTFDRVGGTAPPTDGAIRRFPYYNEDISILKRTPINERVGVEFRADFLNIFNRTLFGFDQGGDQYGSVLQGNNLGGGLGSFGHITSQSNFPREIQFGLKLTY
ncbi:MAG TPA: TonB-dependent receptor [Terriglobia bacterium]|nr:TonB-dependent receptor [Terriglobia bacterium]